MTVYKIMRKAGGHYESYCPPTGWKRRYRLNRTTVAQRNTGLLAFTSLDAARKWLDRDCSFRPSYIFRGEAGREIPLPGYKVWTRDDVVKCWATPKGHIDYWPEGCIAVSSFRPIAKVEVIY